MGWGHGMVAPPFGHRCVHAGRPLALAAVAMETPRATVGAGQPWQRRRRQRRTQQWRQVVVAAAAGRWSQLSSSTRGQRAQQSHSQLGGMIPQAKQPGNESTASTASLAPTRSFLAGKSSASRRVYPKSVNSRATLAMPSPSTCSRAGRVPLTGADRLWRHPNRGVLPRLVTLANPGCL